MFRKSSSIESKLPKPPTRSEILEDMENFNFELISDEIPENNSSITTITSTTESSKGERDQQSTDAQSGSGKNLVEWWQQFETFLNCIKVLGNKQVQFDVKKKNLTRLDTTLSNMSTDITNQLNDGFERARCEIDDDCINLK